MNFCEDCQAPDGCFQAGNCILKYVKHKDITQPEINESIDLANLPDFEEDIKNVFVVHN